MVFCPRNLRQRLRILHSRQGGGGSSLSEPMAMDSRHLGSPQDARRFVATSFACLALMAGCSPQHAKTLSAGCFFPADQERILGLAVEAGLFRQSLWHGDIVNSVVSEARFEYCWLLGRNRENWHILGLKARIGAVLAPGEGPVGILGVGSAVRLNLPEAGRADPSLAPEVFYTFLGPVRIELHYTWSRPIYENGASGRVENMDGFGIAIWKHWYW